MIESQPLIEDTVEEAKAYAGFQTEFLKLLLIEHLSKIGGFLLWRLALLIFGSGAALFVFIAMAVGIGESLGSYFTGFLVSGSGVVLLMGIIFALRRPLFERPLLRKLSQIIPLEPSTSPSLDQLSQQVNAAAPRETR